MNKKILSLLALMLCAVMMLTACGSKETNTDNNASGKSERVVIYTAAEDERIAYIQQELDAKFPNYEIVIQSLGTGQLLSKLQAEGTNGDCDIFYDLEVVNAEIILNANPDLFVDLSEYDFSIYDSSVTGYTVRHHKYAVNGKTAGAFLVNTIMLDEKGLPIPATYEDMLDPQYAGLISMPSPKSSGTGYSYYNGMITILGDEAGQAYFESLNPNIKEYTTSGSAPAGSMAIGWTTVGKLKYFFDSKGKAVTGFATLGGSVYYFWPSTTKNHYRGTMATGWASINDCKYYFGSNGKEQTGFRTIDGKSYYFWPSTTQDHYKGTMATGKQTINGKTYTFGKDGVMKK